MDKPDWRTPEDYAYTDKLTLKGWIWELLRRNPAYHTDYGEYRQQALELEKIYGKDWRAQPQARIYDPPKKPGEADKKWMKRVALTSVQEPKRKRLDFHYGKKWHLKGMYDPEKWKQPVAFLPVQKFPAIMETPDDLDHFIKVEPFYEPEEPVDDRIVFSKQYAVVVYDLVHDLPVQLAEAKRTLNERKKGMKGKRSFINRGAWKRHLRVLDSLLSDPRPKIKVIGEVLGTNEKEGQTPEDAGKEYKRAAEKMITKQGHEKLIRACFRDKAKKGNK